ncbi:hypothetical protein [Lactobacillus helveticus]|uniref:hypothetical protein n=1 Tax=Lactobacillus helveticus TaxID=1587 RepID=UPI0015625BC3|nr:hypothetical protein [Lactobacillus helveticus]NRN96663.1 hypothetical protein [Lactobacillus helveticus]
MFNRKNPHFLGNIGIAFLSIFVLIGIFNKLSNPDDGSDSSSSRSTVEQQKKKAKKIDNRPNMLGHKLNKNKAKSVDDGEYYVERGDNRVRYFVTEGKITAIKFIMKPANNTVMVQAALSNLLHDDHLKYTSDKYDEDSVILKPKYQYNVWSPKNKKWYHVAMQANGDEFKGFPLVSQFSVWEDKDPDAL